MKRNRRPNIRENKIRKHEDVALTFNYPECRNLKHMSQKNQRQSGLQSIGPNDTL